MTTTTTISKKLQILKEGIDADKALLAESKSIVIPDSPLTPAPFGAALFAGILAGLGGLLIGIALGTIYIAPML